MLTFLTFLDLQYLDIVDRVYVKEIFGLNKFYIVDLESVLQ